MGVELSAVRHSRVGGGASAKAVGKSSAEQRKIFCIRRNAGIGKRPRVAGENDKCGESALAEEKRSQERGASLP